MTEKIIKSKSRVQKHGEVFTPKSIVNKMLNLPEIKKACESLTATFLEPSAGEGAFLVEILNRKLEMVSRKFNNDLAQFENYSLLALSTLYGVELLEDNAQTCVMNMFQKYYEIYTNQVDIHNGKINQKVLDSAKTIISSNIGNGNFLTRKAVDGTPLVFSEWEILNLRKNTKFLKVQRTEYTLEEIYSNTQKVQGQSLRGIHQDPEQLDMFSFLEESPDELVEDVEMRYIPVKIIDVFKEEMEEL